jgi:hypothetical protein
MPHSRYKNYLKGDMRNTKVTGGNQQKPLAADDPNFTSPRI